eukprot:TRINITY_DN2395_c0_g2_i1.p1 TRINITY_DN2395_c0_g2~~TRINITY_DN2395_c0_g2_i1.p1  ORF type:complete len:113 (+),score=9.04 TRINITY_DN2395_c0_g2_i1:669-1007(+)
MYEISLVVPFELLLSTLVFSSIPRRKKQKKKKRFSILFIIFSKSCFLCCSGLVFPPTHTHAHMHKEDYGKKKVVKLMRKKKRKKERKKEKKPLFPASNILFTRSQFTHIKKF